MAALSLAACGSDNKSASTGSPAATPSTPATVPTQGPASVPKPVKKKGTIKVASDATYAPNEFIGPNGKTVIGMDADLAKALGAAMDLKVKVVNASFDAIIPGLAAGKYDLGMSSFTDTKEREQTVNFVTYFSAGTSFFVNATKGPTIKALADLCGHKVSVEKGTTQAADANAQDKRCRSAGKPAVKVLIFPDQNGANLALSSGRADVGMADSPVAAFQVKQSGGVFKLGPTSYGTAPYGIAVPKTSGLADPVLAALRALIANGQYQAILDKWGVGSGAITNPQVNGAVN
jgi:polar amino acid transport system substrate-binding protein